MAQNIRSMYMKDTQVIVKNNILIWVEDKIVFFRATLIIFHCAPQVTTSMSKNTHVSLSFSLYNVPPR